MIDYNNPSLWILIGLLLVILAYLWYNHKHSQNSRLFPSSKSAGDQGAPQTERTRRKIDPVTEYESTKGQYGDKKRLPTQYSGSSYRWRR